MPQSDRVSVDGAKVERRDFIRRCSALGLSGTLLPGILWSQGANAQSGEITLDTIAEAEKIAGLQFTHSEREMLLRGLTRQIRNIEKVRQVPIDNSVPPALRFDPLLPGTKISTEKRPFRATQEPIPDIPSNLEDTAFWPVTRLAKAIETRKISSLDLTKMYLKRLKRYDPKLECVITLTEERALKQARQADQEIAEGKYRGPLHGIPWGAKDLLAAKGYPTTWGAKPYQDQMIDQDATVVTRLDEAGAVLVAKLTLGALAQGDVWFGGRTNSPWNTKRGSSGSSAGPAAATAAGLVAFAIGSETNGSITSPATVCGVTGLRPTFGRVSRHGAMALSWSMDKLGPMCRSVEDCAIVLEAIIGPDQKDPTVVDYPFNYDANQDPTKLRVAYIKSGFNETGKRGTNEQSLDDLRSLGIDPIPIELPDLPVGAMSSILTVEAATAFDELTRSNQDDQLTQQQATAWPNTFRLARFIPAVEYLQANRLRTLLMQQMADTMKDIDVYLTPTLRDLYLGNFTGYPIISLPAGFSPKGEPKSIGLVGKLYGEADLLALAKAFQDKTGHHRRHPDLEA